MFKEWLVEIKQIRPGLASLPKKDRALGALGDRMNNFFDELEEGVVRLERQAGQQATLQRQMELALCHTTDAVAVTDGKGEIRLFNPAFGILADLNGPELIGKLIHDLWHKDSRKTANQLKTQMDQGLSFVGDIKLNRDLFKLAHTTASPTINPDGTVNHFVFTLQDITDQKRLEEEIKQQRDFLEKLVNLSSNLVFVITDQGKTRLDNLAAKTLMADMGKNSRSHLTETFLGLIGSAQKVEPKRIEIPLAKGKIRAFLFQAERVPAAYLSYSEKSGSLFMITLSDLTALETQEKRLKLGQQALAAAKVERSMARRELISGLVLSIQQPVNVAKAVSARLMEQAGEIGDINLMGSGRYLREELDEIEAKLEQFSRFAPQNPDAGGSCRASELAESLKESYQATLGQNRIDWSFSDRQPDAHFPFPLPVMLMMVGAVIDNAIEAIPTGTGKLQLRFYEANNQVLISVEDNGPGIPIENRAKVFQPLFSTKAGHEGISLALVHRLVTRQGGGVFLEDSILGGVRVEISFPKGVK
ncbi:MAG: hypothetical protein A2508_08340 [Candidatus Lambdaproteobacteria bacterium RIFOXYD12_FULL_49_8]|nr:MAG: hypothetical protein A2508_08340 [Candidatus Lambdaproteobacteria bacterium RIFOXYD12_FULL_49_8]